MIILRGKHVMRSEFENGHGKRSGGYFLLSAEKLV